MMMQPFPHPQQPMFSPTGYFNPMFMPYGPYNPGFFPPMHNQQAGNQQKSGEKAEKKEATEGEDNNKSADANKQQANAGPQQPPPPPMMMPYMMPPGFRGPFFPMPPFVPPTRGISLALACDVEQLSEYQILVRQQLELFEATQEDVESNTQGRKKPVSLGQVGLRCRHCAALPLRARGRGSVYYPFKLSGIYQASQNMSASHLCQSCQHIPPQIKAELKSLRERRDNASGGKRYWADGCRAQGVVETESGLKLVREAPPAAAAAAAAATDV